MKKVKPSIEKYNTYKSKGFSLVELGVVLAIVSVIGVGSLMVYSEQKDHASWMESQAKLVVVKASLLKFAAVNKYLPCPDNSVGGNGQESRTLAVGTIPAMPAVLAVAATPKTATAPSIPAIEGFAGQAAIPNIPVSVCTVNSGTVPYELLGLSRASVEDSLGNLFEYAVDQGVTAANTMLDCPTQTACFFNSDPAPVLPAGNIMPGSALPAFNLSTQPLKGALGANNLRICDEPACTNVQSDGLVAVLIAYNQNGRTPSSVNETANQDGDRDFVNANYDKSPFYDDEILGIAANEIKNRNEDESIEVFVPAPAPPAGPVVQVGNDVGNLGDMTTGAVGTNLGTDAGILDEASQSFSFGAERAGEKVVLTFDTHALGAWDKAATTSAGVFDDRGSISANGESLREFDYDHLADPRDGLEEVSFTSAITGRYSDIYNADGSWDSQYVTQGQTVTTWQPYWDESHEFVVTLDENGEIALDFQVETTATIETIDFSNIEIVYYDSPPDVPSFPTVAPISGITQTEGLNDD